MNNPHFTMPKVRILVADASKARLFRVDSPTGELIELSSDVNPEARLHDSDLTTDKPGRAADSNYSGRSAMEDPTDPKEVEAQKFARELTDKLEKARNKGELEKLYIAAPPRFLGELRKHFKPELKSLVVEEIGKDFSHMDAKNLRKHLPERLK
ncbi:protein required for attachment to host cells [Halospina denitrificans]|uniref:Protein required for attachment to host cells n=1 Tax=Halospina denitrificans TaxID=332522 RepID=A0A4R7JX66_9GAMM|nr:host attachment protein [Halospina denitrificans]TDT43041.1 protein required for attachment to host cells [Halospina denitrificans]